MLTLKNNECRLAFHGKILEVYEEGNEDYKKNLKITKAKSREGIVDKVTDNRNIIGRNLFSKETPVTPFINMKIVLTETGEVGKITGAFGKSGKFKARFDEDLKDPENLKNKPLHMPFKKLLFDETHKMVQTL